MCPFSANPTVLVCAHGSSNKAHVFSLPAKVCQETDAEQRSLANGVIFALCLLRVFAQNTEYA